VIDRFSQHRRCSDWPGIDRLPKTNGRRMATAVRLLSADVK
jgi:hypothetical protein